MKRITLKDIAERCGVTPTMVSAVLNNRNGRITCSPKKRIQIQQTAAELDYRPNLLARSMVARKIPLVGMMLHLHEDDFTRKTNDYFLSLFPDMTFRLNKYNLEVLFIPYSSEDEQVERLSNLIGNNLLGGVITNIIPGSYRKTGQYLQENEIPYMLLGRPAEDDLYCAYISGDLLFDRFDFKKYANIFHVSIMNHDLHITKYPFPHQHYWLAPKVTLAEKELLSTHNLFIVNGVHVYEKMQLQRFKVNNIIITENPDKEKLLPSGVSYIIIDKRHSRYKLSDYVSKQLADWMLHGKKPPQRIYQISSGPDVIVKKSILL